MAFVKNFSLQPESSTSSPTAHVEKDRLYSQKFPSDNCSRVGKCRKRRGLIRGDYKSHIGNDFVDPEGIANFLDGQEYFDQLFTPLSIPARFQRINFKRACDALCRQD